MQAADKTNNSPSNHEPDSILAEAHSVVTTSHTESFQAGNRTQVCRLLDSLDQLGDPIMQGVVFDRAKVFREAALEYGLHRRFRRIRKTASRPMGAEREPSLIA